MNGRNSQQDVRYVGADIETLSCADGCYYKGIVYTHYGIVRVYSQKDWTRLDMILEGVHYTNERGLFHQPRYLVTLANRFAFDIYRAAEKEKGET